MDNPIFDFIDEGMNSGEILENMGFCYAYVLSDVDDEVYTRDVDAWLQNWKPEFGDYVLVKKYDTENGPVALFVRPETRYAEALLNFGFSEIAQQAARLDHEDAMMRIKMRGNATAIENGKPLIHDIPAGWQPYSYQPQGSGE